MVLQTSAQAEMMKQSSRVIFVDATHGITAYGYYLLSMVVLDRHGHGLVVGWAISSKENHHTWMLMGKHLRPEALNSKPEVMMADDNNSAWNGLTTVWPTLRHKLLCHWHVMKNVRERCGNRGSLKKSKVNDGTNSEKCVSITTETFGTPTWELFYIMMKETNEESFRHQLKLFRSGLRTHGQLTLLDYFETTYFREDRIVQWACWFRRQMYDCDWLADTNMHIESWHNFFKTFILHRKSNVRVDTLIKALMKAEKTCYWKWCRVQYGYVENADPRWIKMLGLNTVVEPESGLSPCRTSDPVHVKVSERRVTSWESVQKKNNEIQQKIHSGILQRLTTNTLEFVSKHLSCVDNLLKTETAPPNLVTTAKLVTNQRVIPRVIEQYKFGRKKAKIFRNSMSIKSFRGNEQNRHNRAASFALSTDGHMSHTGSVETPISSLRCTLSVMRKRNRITLGGISFSPMIGGMVVPILESTGSELRSLHVRVVKVMFNSPAYEFNVTTQMFLKSMALVDDRRVGEHVLMTATQCRDVRSPKEKEADIWRHPRDVPDQNRLNLESMINRVDLILTEATDSGKRVEIELVYYTN